MDTNKNIAGHIRNALTTYRHAFADLIANGFEPFNEFTEQGKYYHMINADGTSISGLYMGQIPNGDCGIADIQDNYELKRIQAVLVKPMTVEEVA